MFQDLGLINTSLIKVNAPYGNLAFGALQSCYLLLFLYMYAYDFFEGIKDLESTRRRDYYVDIFNNLISKVSPKPTQSEKKTATLFYISAIRCMPLIMLK